jgi:hypothetical protein
MLVIPTGDGSGEQTIPIVLGVDAMAVEPYSEKSKRMLLLKDVRVDLDSTTMRALEEKAEISSYFFVYYMMPLDPKLPKLVLSVIPHKSGKANEQSNAHLKNLKAICRQAGFMTAAFSADGDNTYEEFLRPICAAIFSDEGQQMSFLEIVAEVGEMEFPFVTDLLHFLKCLRKRLAHYPLSLDSALPPIVGDDIAELLGVGECLKPKSKGVQHKDAIALRVFTLENLVTLLTKNQLQEALYFLPIVLWHVANQALNVTRDARIKLLGTAFDVTRRCAVLYDECGLTHSLHFGEATFFWRRDDIDKMLVSLAVLGHILTLPIPRIALNRIGTMDLEHLFGFTRVAERGNNQHQRIIRRLVKSSFIARIAEHWGLATRRKRQHNASAVYDGMLAGDEFLDLNDMFDGYNPAEVMFEVLGWTGAVPDLINEHAGWKRCQEDFARAEPRLLGRIKDGQKLPALTWLSGTAIVARFEAISKITGHTKLYWPVAHLLTLQGLLHQQMTLPDLSRRMTQSISGHSIVSTRNVHSFSNHSRTTI